MIGDLSAAIMQDFSFLLSSGKPFASNAQSYGFSKIVNSFNANVWSILFLLVTFIRSLTTCINEAKKNRGICHIIFCWIRKLNESIWFNFSIIMKQGKISKSK